MLLNKSVVLKPRNIKIATASGRLSPSTTAPRIGLGFELGLALVLGLGAIFLRGNCPRTDGYH